MGNRNYAGFSKNKNNQIMTNQVMSINNDIEQKETSIEEVEETPIIKEGTGIIVNCNLLYIRGDASKESDILGLLSRGDKVKVYFDESTKDFYKIKSLTDIVGYCMKDYIKID